MLDRSGRARRRPRRRHRRRRRRRCGRPRRRGRSRERHRRACARRCRLHRPDPARPSIAGCSTSIACAMRCRNRSAPSPKPTRMPSVRSRNTTRRKVTPSTTASPREARTRVAISCFSAMFQATTASRAASAASGMKRPAALPTSMNSSRKTECDMPATGPARAGADIGRGAGDGAGDADAAEQGRGDVGRRLGPRARSSSGAGGRSCCRRPRPRAGSRSRPAGRTTRPRAASRPRARARGRAAAVPAARWGCRRTGCRWSPPAGRAAQAATEARATAIRNGGPVRAPAPHGQDHADGAGGDRDGGEIDAGQRRRQCLQLRDDRPGLRRRKGQAQQLLELAGEDDDRDAGREPDGHRIGHVLDEAAELQEARSRAG